MSCLILGSTLYLSYIKTIYSIFIINNKHINILYCIMPTNIHSYIDSYQGSRVTTPPPPFGYYLYPYITDLSGDNNKPMAD